MPIKYPAAGDVGSVTAAGSAASAAPSTYLAVLFGATVLLHIGALVDAMFKWSPVEPGCTSASRPCLLIQRSPRFIANTLRGIDDSTALGIEPDVTREAYINPAPRLSSGVDLGMAGFARTNTTGAPAASLVLLLTPLDDPANGPRRVDTFGATFVLMVLMIDCFSVIIQTK